MRRDPSADNGLVELMVASLADRAAAFGVGRVSLNFAMFREAFERGAEIGAGPIARLWRQALLVASRNWQLESLYRSNAKYQPEWQPRYICFEYTSDLPRVGTAAGSAEGFPTRPSLAMLSRHGKEPAAGALERAGEEYVAEVTAHIPEEPDALAEVMSTEGLPEQIRYAARSWNACASRASIRIQWLFHEPIPSRRSGKRRVIRPIRVRVVRFRSPAASSLVGMAASSASLLCATEPATCKS